MGGVVSLQELAEVHVPLGSDRTIRLLDSLDSWAGCVRRFQRELDGPADALDAFGADDFVGALFGRDRIESALEAIAAGRDKPPTLDAIDELFRTITVPDDAKLLSLAAETRDGWWWARIPKGGPVVEDLRTWAKNAQG